MRPRDWAAALLIIPCLLLAALASSANVISRILTINVTPASGCGGACPLGVSAPSGFHWVLTTDDEFVNDTSLDTNLWSNGSTSDTIYFDSNGLNIQPTSASNSCSSGQSCASGIGSTSFSRFGFWEWVVRWPRLNDGTGDGYHFDTYINNGSASGIYQEVGIGEVYQISGFEGITHFYCCGSESPPHDATVENDFNADTSFHTIGVWWKDTGSGNGTQSSYFDGSALYADGAVCSCWGSGGAQIVMNNIACNLGGCDSSTATSGNPLSYKYFRYWVLAAN
jgi:hypothetical protein